MPPLSAYTPFESLLFFQSLASHDSCPSNFISISDLLRNNPFVRQNVAYDADRLSPEALEDLYTTLMQDGLETAATGPNGHATDPSTNLKKRKISSPRPDGLVDGVARHSYIVPELVAHLYAKYKELVTREIRQEEKRYREIRDDIERIHREEQQSPPVPVQPPQAQVPAGGPEPMDVDVKEEEKQVQRPVVEVPGQIPTTHIEQQQSPQLPPQPRQPNIPQRHPSAQEPSTAQRPSVQQPQQGQPLPDPVPQLQQLPQPPQPVSHAQTVHPPPAPHINGKSPVPPQPPAITPRNPPNQLPPTSHIPPGASTNPSQPAAPAVQGPNGLNVPGATFATPSVPTPTPQKTAQQSTPTATHARAPSQLPPQPASGFQQWPLNAPTHTPQTPFPPHGTPQYPNTNAARRPVPTPLQQIPQTEPGKPYPRIFSPALPTTPGPRTQVQTPLTGPLGGFETPRAASFSDSRSFHQHRLSIDTSGSATPWKRPPRLSILQSPGSPDRPRPEDVSPISERAPSPEFSEPAHRRRTRPVEDKKATKTERFTLSGRKRRDESTPSSRSRGRSRSVSQVKVKHEMPSTPAGVPDAVEAEPRGIAGRKSQDERLGRGRPKRKRDTSEPGELESFHAEISRLDSSQAGQYVLSARNFPRTGAPIMNDVTMHKHASIFTKPLTERDAPGYRDLIYRPQDLKSIKSLIHQGSKAVNAATEAASTPAADGESPAPSGTPSKNAVLMLPKTEDVIPPKAVVNSAQLEKELIRMFANAIMFNPVPERGFGPGFPMISESGSRESTQVPEADEGGIIKDTVEMFEDVEQAVTRWRAAERTADELASKSILSLRRASDPNNPDGVDDAKEP
ncbi:uncharacterized protein EURHEDRAFT_303732 [Aspergillus ruber CBS 135680]|uniref:Uncharacterized protein n=1 Tax=Aspergillus ruber (strain CBS 135680) TaxID=1388766 RepID=A0A017SL96_ASPRC|nr:uncharacterized protein EURHEDRAFT_303732 [Aspergillus ruber CBS 135680]EYE97722.1 hypothetical protein EURHEDRAFT_303732 [Aspergillus ruber CBS 135680]